MIYLINKRVMTSQTSVQKHRSNPCDFSPVFNNKNKTLNTVQMFSNSNEQ